MRKTFVTLGLLAAPFGFGSPLEFSAYIQNADELKILITDLEDRKSSGWLAVGQSFRGYEVVAFDRKSEVVTLKGAADTLKLQLKESRVGEEKAKPAETKVNPLFSGPTYNLRAGDTGAVIIRESGLTLEQLKKLNPDVNWSRLRVGQEIRLRETK